MQRNLLFIRTQFCLDDSYQINSVYQIQLECKISNFIRMQKYNISFHQISKPFSATLQNNENFTKCYISFLLKTTIQGKIAQFSKKVSSVMQCYQPN